MLRSEVSVNGLVSRSAVTKTNSEGKPFISFGLKVDVPHISEIRTVLDFSVSCDGDDASAIVLNARIEAKGTLTFKKRGDKVYLNLHASELNINPASSTDIVTGTLSFRGSVGKNIDSRTDKNGKPYHIFSGFSTEKVEEMFEYTWVRFVLFGDNRIVKPQAKIEATGEMELSIYKEKLNISCRLGEVKEWNRQPQSPETPVFNEQSSTDERPL